MDWGPLARFFSGPLAIRSGQEAELLAAVRAEFEFVQVVESEPNWPGYDVLNGVAIINVEGVLVHKPTYCWGETSYDSICRSFVGAIVNPDVRAIALVVDSPGGEVCGMYDAADVIWDLRKVKPAWAIVNESAYSAAYALACSMDRIVVPRTGGTGSIGVIAMHFDITKMLDESGVKVSTIQFGARKSDLYPTTTLSSEARARLQADVDKTGEMFVDLVARNRSIDPDAVRGTEAGTFQGQDGVDAGLADEVMSCDEAILELMELASKRT